jgi:hypothetical protein
MMRARATSGAARVLVAALWAGSLWALGYLAAPAVFATVDSALAGNIVARLLERQAWVGMACAAVLFAMVGLAPDLDVRRRRFLAIVIAAMLACTLVIYFGLQPLMAQLREAAGPVGVRHSPYWTRFAAMHGVSQLLHLVESVLGAILLVKIR